MKLILLIISVLLSFRNDVLGLSLNENLEKDFDYNYDKAYDITDGVKSLPFSLKAFEISQKIGNKKYVTKACIEVCHDYEKIGDLSSALKYIFIAANIAEKGNDLVSMAIVYNSIGTIYRIQNNERLAILYMNKAIEIHKRINSPNVLGDDYNNLGEIHRVSHHYELAMINFKKAFDIYLSLKNDYYLAYAAGNIGLVFAALGQKDSATFYISKAADILRIKNDYYPITVYLIESANVYLKEGNTEEALKEAIQALEISRTRNFREQVRDASKILSEIYTHRKDYKNAFQALQQYYNAKDSISNNKVIGDMAEMRADYEVSKKESEIKGLEAINTLRTRINVGLSIGVFLVIVLSVFLFRLNRNLKTANLQLSQQKVELEQKNEIIRASLEEKETLLKEIHHRVKNNLQIISSLLSLQSQGVKNKKMLDAFQESQQRLHSIALIHQKLYQNENLARINIQSYIDDLVGTIHQSFHSKHRNIDFQVTAEGIDLDIDTAVPLGLIVNELATNAYKYAFSQVKDGILTISMKRNMDMYRLIIKDNGPGIPENINIFETESLGLRLVSILSRQLQGKLEVKSDNGAAFYLDFADVMKPKA